MALGFLSDLADIGEFGMSVYNLFDGEKEPRGLDELMATAEESRRYLQAATDPNDPMFQELAAEEEETLTRDYASALRDIMTQNRRARARGHIGMMAVPERRDETVARAMAARKETAKDTARTNVRNYLMAAAGKSGVAMTGFGTVANADAGYQNARRQEESDAWSALFGGARAIGEHGLFPHTRALLTGDPSESRDIKPMITPGTTGR